MKDAAVQPDTTNTSCSASESLKCGSASMSFDNLVSKYAERMNRLCYRLSGWSGETDDLVQDTFLAAYKGWRKFRGESDPGTWLTRIAVNCCRRQARKQRFLRLAFDWGKAEASGTTPDAEADLAERERLSLVRSRINVLPRKYRETVVLHYLEGLPVQETAEVLGLSKNAAEVRLNRARQRLREGLADLMDG